MFIFFKKNLYLSCEIAECCDIINGIFIKRSVRMRLPSIEKHDAYGCYTDESRKIAIERARYEASIKRHFADIDVPILCVPELLEENIEKVKEWYLNGGRVHCYSSIAPFTYGLSVVTLEDFNESFYYCDTFDKIGLIDERGNEKLACSAAFESITVLNEKLIRVQNRDESFSLISLETGKTLQPSNLYYIDTALHDGMLACLVNKPSAMEFGKGQANQYVYFDESGNVAISFSKYASMGQFRNGVALAMEEKCTSRWLSFPVFADEHTYNYYKYLIDKRGKVVAELGCIEYATKREHLLDTEPYDRRKGGKLFQANEYHKLNERVSASLRFEEPCKRPSSSFPFLSTSEMRQLILNGQYNPEDEIKRVIEMITHYTNNWGECIDSISYYSKEGHTRKVPYIYYLNRDRLQYAKDYTPEKPKALKKEL